jgi:hypothetical protein
LQVVYPVSEWKYTWPTIIIIYWQSLV